jgi:hypothetical protein
MGIVAGLGRANRVASLGGRCGLKKPRYTVGGLRSQRMRRGSRAIAIDDGLAALLPSMRNRTEHEQYSRLAAGVPDGADVDLPLVKLSEGALIFPAPAAGAGEFDFTRPRDSRNITKVFSRRAAELGFPKLRFHHLRGTHETLLPNADVPAHLLPCDTAMTRQPCSAFMPSGRGRPIQARRRDQNLVRTRARRYLDKWVQIGST